MCREGFEICGQAQVGPDFLSHDLSPLELPHDKTNKMTFVPGEVSGQPGHRPSLIRVFAVCMKKHWVLSYQLSTLQRF